jgi:ketosteroid isomerase-like protein
MSTTSAAQDIAVVQRFLETTSVRDYEGARDVMADDFVVDEAGGLPYTGIFHGPDGHFQLVDTIMDQMDLSPVGPFQIDPVDGGVACRFTLKFTRKDTGASHTMKLVEIYGVRDGKITSLDVFYKDPLAVARLLEG